MVVRFIRDFFERTEREKLRRNLSQGGSATKSCMHSVRLEMLKDENSETPFVSVVVCTYNRKNLLKACLNSIYAQDYPKPCIEVIIVDGGSTDGTEDLCKEFPQIRFVTETKRGLAHARNMGAELARSSIVAYTDDDCIVDKHWLKNLVAGFKTTENIVGVGGIVLPAHPELIPPKILVRAALGLMDYGDSATLNQCLLTSNVAFKKQLFEFIKFDETLGTTRRGKIILCGEDTDFCQTLLDLGYNLLYEPKAKVYHQINKDRAKVTYIIKHAIHNGISQTRVYIKKKRYRIWAIRYASSQLLQSVLKIFSDRSFTTCYLLIASISTLIVSFTRLDRIL